MIPEVSIQIYYRYLLVLLLLLLPQSGDCFQPGLSHRKLEFASVDSVSLSPRPAGDLLFSRRPRSSLVATRASKNQNEDNQSSSLSILFGLLKSGRESDFKPGNANFFYNDEVMSHLHGYVFLVGLFFAQDPVRAERPEY